MKKVNLIVRNIIIPDDEIKIAFIKSSGPGGQNINKVSTGVQLKFDVINSKTLPKHIKSKMLKISGKRLSKEGILIIEAKRFRTQEKNRKDAIERLISLIKEASRIKKIRKKSYPSQSSVETRIEYKKRRSQIKKLRKRINKNFE